MPPSVAAKICHPEGLTQLPYRLIWLNHPVYHSTTGVPSLHMTSQVDTLTPYTYCPVPINTTMNITDVECIYINGCTDSYTRWSYLVWNYSTILVHEVQEWIVQNKSSVLILAAWAEELPEGKSCVLNVFTCSNTNSTLAVVQNCSDYQIAGTSHRQWSGIYEQTQSLHWGW